jgi:hypothetical protein
MDKLWETVPVWRSVMKSYEPNAGAVEQIKATNNETTVTLAYGTWCPDSKNYVPRLIKALSGAGNDKIQVKLVGIDNQFREPVDRSTAPDTNVPTVIVERGGREIGRIVEHLPLRRWKKTGVVLNGKQPSITAAGTGTRLAMALIPIAIGRQAGRRRIVGLFRASEAATWFWPDNDGRSDYRVFHQ